MAAEQDLVTRIEAEQRKTRILSLIALELNKPATLKEKLDTILYFLDTVFGLKHTMLLLPQGDELTVFASRGFNEDGLGVKVKTGVGIVGVVAARKQKLRVSNISWKKQYVRVSLPHQQEQAQLPGLPGVESQVAIPLLAGDELIAVLTAESRDLNFFSAEDEEFLMTLSQIIGLSIQHTQIMESLEATVKERTLSLELQAKQLQQANCSKDKLFTIIAHDLRSPAASLQSAATLMHHHVLSGNTDKAAQTGDLVAKTARSLSSMLDNLLTWSLTQSGELRINKTPLDAVELMNDVLDGHADAINAKSLIIDFKPPASHAVVSTDRNACFSILHNVLSNAIKFSHNGGKISISFDQHKNHLMVNVSDEGLGMSAQKIQEIMTSTVNTSTRGTANEKGAGVGLAACFGLAERIDAIIALKSKEAAGTTVAVKLPL